MGYSMRTDRYRFTRWQKRADPEDIVAYELYDLENDPQGLVNIAERPESGVVIRELMHLMTASGIGDKRLP